jgi:uncharacterized protein YjbI with pentapeptide repeats
MAFRCAILRHPSWKGEAMANEEQLALLKAGVEGWNKWREDEPSTVVDLREANLTGTELAGAVLRFVNLSRANLSRANLSGADLGRADLRGANLQGANLQRANLWGADLHWDEYSPPDGNDINAENFMEIFRVASPGADLSEANLREAQLGEANLIHANFSRADLSNAYLKKASLLNAQLVATNLSGADLSHTDLSQADLSQANLTGVNLGHSHMVETNINNAKISRSNVYGVNVWDLVGEFEEQKDLVITPEFQKSTITVDNIKVAQFVYLILNNKEIRDVINTLTSKSVLILGRFALPDRKAILDALRDKLREYDLLPIVFDFDRPSDKDFTETIKTLAGLCYFVIADVTNPKSSPLELQATVPDYQIPFVPIIQEGEQPFAMMVDLQKKYNWVLDTVSYDTLETLIEALKPAIIDRAIQKHNELRLIKAQQPKILSASDFIKDKGLDSQSG